MEMAEAGQDRTDGGHFRLPPPNKDFAAVLRWYLDEGAQNGRLGNTWGIKDFAYAVGVSDRAVRGWLKEDLPHRDKIEIIARKFFGSNPQAHVDHRRCLMDAYRRTEAKAAAQTPAITGNPPEAVPSVISRYDLTTWAKQKDEELKRSRHAPGFADWRDEQLQRHYSQLLDPKSKLGPFAFPALYGRLHSVICLPGNRARTEFEHKLLFPRSIDSIERREPRQFPNLSGSSAIRLPEGLSEEALEYAKLMIHGGKIRRPNMIGFALRELQLDERGVVQDFNATICTYMENVLSNHILEHRLTRAFGMPPHEAARLVDNRPKLHLSKKKGGSGLSIGNAGECFPLISVQALVLYRDKGAWSTVRITRNDDVAVSPRAKQFPPAGGFEIFGTEHDKFEDVSDQFDLRIALKREFLEECADDKDASAEGPTGDIPVSELKGMQRIAELEEAGRFHIRFLGVVLDLITLRPEFSFLIVIEGDRPIRDHFSYQLHSGKFAHWLKPNSEEARRPQPTLVRDLHKVAREPNWHNSSVGLMKLAHQALVLEQDGLERRFGLEELTASLATCFAK